jgi:hypothetical protein
MALHEEQYVEETVGRSIGRAETTGRFEQKSVDCEEEIRSFEERSMK